MELISTLQEVTPPGHMPRTLITFSAALLFAAIFLWGGRASRWLGERAHHRFLSFGAGISVSYTFVHILPGLRRIGELQSHAQADYIRRLFPEYSVYLAALLGFLVFYGLERLPTRTQPGSGNTMGPRDGVVSWQAWVHTGGFAWYTWLITFLMVRTGKGVVALGVFADAMGMHIAPITNRLRGEYPDFYARRGGRLLALACLAGWASGLTLHISGPVVLDMVAVVAGGVIVNAAIAELPGERKASYWSFFTGAVSYTALLLVLAHLEEH